MEPDLLKRFLDLMISAAPLLGHPLEDRCRVREAQDRSLVKAFQEAGKLPLTNAQQRALFLVAPLDILVAGDGGSKRFHITETNGTGIGGLTNMPEDVIATILAGLTAMAHDMAEQNPLVLVASSGMESSSNPRRNHLLHEKVLCAEALRTGFASRGQQARVVTMAHLAADSEPLPADQPVMVLGYIKEFLNELSAASDGRLTLRERPVTAAVNDRFCLNVVSRFGNQLDLRRFATMNRCFHAGADKGIAYGLFNEYARAHPSRYFPEHIEFDRADSRAALVAEVCRWLRKGRRVVIKPQGTGLGHGLEFFLDSAEPLDSVIGKIDHSIRVTEHYYGAVGGAFPYTVCDFVDTCAIRGEGHPLFGHKYEIRIVVYRDGSNLMALPSNAKVSSECYDADKPSKLSLINNITTSAEAKKREGSDFLLPLANAETLELLEIDLSQLRDLCAFCTGYVRHILDQVQKRPQQFGFPADAHRPVGGVVNGQRLQEV